MLQPLFKYMLPLGLVYYAEYFINQALVSGKCFLCVRVSGGAKGWPGWAMALPVRGLARAWPDHFLAALATHHKTHRQPNIRHNAMSDTLL